MSIHDAGFLNHVSGNKDGAPSPRADAAQVRAPESKSDMASTTPVPQKVDDLDLAFGGKMDKLLPKWEAIPDEYKSRRNPWAALVSQWFFGGLDKAKFAAKQGIDGQTATRHVQAIMGSFEPKHEHKEAACAYLLASWFERVTYEKDGKQHICP